MLDSDINHKRKMLEELYALQHNEKKQNEMLINLGGMAPDKRLLSKGIALAGVGGDPRVQNQVFQTNKNVDRTN